jgi:hypothetical protein
MNFAAYQFERSWLLKFSKESQRGVQVLAPNIIAAGHLEISQS